MDWNTYCGASQWRLNAEAERIKLYEADLRDDSEFRKWQTDMRVKDDQDRMDAIEKRRAEMEAEGEAAKELRSQRVWFCALLYVYNVPAAHAILNLSAVFRFPFFYISAKIDACLLNFWNYAREAFDIACGPAGMGLYTGFGIQLCD